MKRNAFLTLASSVLCAALTASAATRYVNLNNPAPAWPYTTWADAATNIQDAVDAALAGDDVLVTNGVYQTGARAVDTTSNRVVIAKPISVRSVNGPAVTSIVGFGPNGSNAIRCVRLGNHALLAGFTLTNGATQLSGDTTNQGGGGAWCDSTNVAITNCVLTGNSAGLSGGGAYSGTLDNCVLKGNRGGGAYGCTLNNCTVTESSGGGAVGCTLNNCTLARNTGYEGGGANGGTLNNCTVSGNSAQYGGGTYDSTLNGCTLTGNSASVEGGATYGGVLNNCSLTGNSAAQGGGGAIFGTLNNCTLTGNSISGTNPDSGYYLHGSGGGVFQCILNNCIIYYNTAAVGENYDDTTRLNFCCTTPLPARGTNNTFEPQLASASHLSADSPCRGRGSAAYAGGVDIDGEIWSSPPSIGCDEYWSGSVTGSISVAIAASYTNVAVGFGVDFQALIGGRVSASRWDFGDGVVVSNRPWLSHAWVAPGDYVVELRAYNESYPAGIAANVTFHVVDEVHYVALLGTNPLPPYASWATAAGSIQAAVDSAVTAGALVLVSNGVYQTGLRAVYGASNRVAVTKPVTVRSFSGPTVTSIAGSGGVRCVYLINHALLAGFTLTNGSMSQSSGGTYTYTNGSGGAVWCESRSAVVSNCVLTANWARFSGGGSYSGTLNNCILTGNGADDGGGAKFATLNDCTLTNNTAYSQGGGASGATLNGCILTSNSVEFQGGGAFQSTLNNCILRGNAAAGYTYYRGCGGGASGCTLNNCMLIGNWALEDGGGADGGTLNNCMLTGNLAYLEGGGGYWSTLNNCVLTGNSAYEVGGGTYRGTLHNCTLTANSVSTHGSIGGAASTLYNCIAYYNIGGNYGDGGLNYCCTTPLPDAGEGNITTEPELASVSHLSAGSPCRGRGSGAYVLGVDIDGEPWANPPSVGCDEYWSGSVTGSISVAIVVSYTNVAVGFGVDFQELIGGRLSASRWDFGDGVVISNRPWVTHAWVTPGEYAVELRAYNESYPAGIAATVTVQVANQPVHYVALTSANPVPPYNSWAAAATNIQDAVDAATVPGALVLVTNGAYQSGARVVYGITNRVAVTKPTTLRSVNGPAVTSIMGSGPNGPGAVRCVYLSNGSLLAGFTLTNGATHDAYAHDYYASSGGGVWCESLAAVVSNCVLAGNSAYVGGGAFSGMLNNCTLTGNSASNSGGGAFYSTLNNCTLTSNSSSDGGGTSDSTLKNCTLTGNSARGAGGASYYGLLNNCTLTGNSASQDNGGGAYAATLNNCVLTRNSTLSDGGGGSSCLFNNCTLAGNSAWAGGGAYASTLNNCIIYLNTGGYGENVTYGTLNYCCTIPLPTNGLGNFTNAPMFADTNGWSNLRLQTSSPCINAGNNVYAPGLTDLDGRPRIVSGTVDMGAYEFQPGADGAFIGWLSLYGLPADGSADTADTDGDGLNNWQEWVAGNDPTSADSVLRILSATSAVSGVTVTWSSVINRSYALERAINLGSAPAFSVLESNIAGLGGTNSWTDTNTAGSAPRFYRVRVEN